MWPFLLDMTKLECKKSLRNLELEAYANIITVFRAQGELNEKKREILKDLQILLHITLDRHKAELRRAVNDEKLNTIAKRLSSNKLIINKKWQQESKRTIPVLPRIPPTTYYKLIADQLVDKSKQYLEALAHPSETGLKRAQKEAQIALKDPNIAYLNEDLSVNYDNEIGTVLAKLKSAI